MSRRIWRRYTPSKWKSLDGIHIPPIRRDSAKHFKILPLTRSSILKRASVSGRVFDRVAQFLLHKKMYKEGKKR